ncbi:agenet domain-containing family protein [Striga asiatica]|uniref:Agenet domain-containing family protein n=1 Tax=Striga asiatica TaxID=4170 RepID=A0A5A7NZ71_STRAF|nr:agenet domain-containing family protein [Striga asiatica]
MDYNDNDYEGHNLHLAGEESSKTSSVLRPFALPKFDFDDSLQGHMRFDSLVENEVFLGISSQEDNQWIGDFSREGSGIEFSSSATQSCALPRHINVWSEATSSESVEMLLKAVGQEEMVRGEKLMEEPEPGDQLGSPTRQMDDVGHDNKTDDVKPLKNSSISPAEVEGNTSRSYESDKVEDVQMEVSVPAGVTNISSYGVSGDGNDGIRPLNSENPVVNLKMASDNQDETFDLVNESMSTHTQQETVSVLHIERGIDKTDSSTQNVATSVKESDDQDNITDVCFVSSNDVANAISLSREQQEKGCDQNEGNLGAGTDFTGCQASHKIPSPMESSKEEHSGQICDANIAEACSVAKKNESVSTEDRCNEVGFLVAGDSQHRTVVLASSIEIKKLPEGYGIVHEESSMSLQGETVKLLEVQGSDAVMSTVSGDTDPNHFPVIQPPDHNAIFIGTKNIQPGTDSSAEAPLVTSVVIGNPSDKTLTTFEGGFCGEKSVNDDVSVAGDPAVAQENLDDQVDHADPPLLAGSVKTGTEDTIPMQLDPREDDLDFPVYETGIKKLPLDSSDVACDGNEKEVSTFSGEEGIKGDTSTGSQPNSSSGACPALNTEAEDAKLTSSFAEGIEFVDREKHNSPSYDTTLRDLSKETQSEALKQPTIPVSTESLESSELNTALETEKGTLPESETGKAQQSGQCLPLVQPSGVPMLAEGHKESSELTSVFEMDKGAPVDVETREIRKSDQSLVLVEPSNTISDEYQKDLPEKIGYSSSDLTVQDVGVVAAPTEVAIGQAGRNAGEYPSIVSVNHIFLLFELLHWSPSYKPEKQLFFCSFNGFHLQARFNLLYFSISPNNLSSAVDVVAGTSCTMEMDKSDQVAPSDVICNDLPESVINNQSSLKRDDVENICKVVTKAENSVVNVPSEEEGTFTFDVRPLGDQSSGGSCNGSQSFPKIEACKLSLTAGVSPSTSGSNLADPVAVKEVSHVSSLTPPSEPLRGPSGRKTRRASSKPRKASANKGNQVKETTSLRQPEKLEKSSLFLSPLVASQSLSFESVVKPRGLVPIPTSSLPDLNTSAASSAFFQQPFTDLQQVQLRAQIFVYGSLIQEAAPDEACMVSAFGFNIQVTNDGLPLEDAGVKAQDQTNRQCFLQLEAFTPISGRASKRPILSPVVNQMVSLSTPLWNISTPSAEALVPGSTTRSVVIDYQTVAPLSPYQTPPVRNYVSHTTRLSPAPFPVPWLAPSQTTPYDVSTTSPAFPGVTEPVKSTQKKESIPVVAAISNNTSASPTSNAVVSATYAEDSLVDLKILNSSTGQAAGTKTSKRKKSSGAEDVLRKSMTASRIDTVSAPLVASQLSNNDPAIEALSPFPSTARNQGDQIRTPVISSHYSTSVAVATPSNFVQKGSPNQFFPVVAPSVTSDQSKGGDLSIDKRAQNIEDFSKVEEAMLQAEEAANQAAAAISQCEGVWKQLDEQKQGGLTSDAQCKLASAAVAIAAAASVAKAAAAAAKIASTAAFQAKQMAEEAVIKSGSLNSTGHDAKLVSNSINLVNASPKSILRVGDRNNDPGLVISTAREAAKKRIEAASAATRYAENLDAIVKASELAAEAVSHAGKIVSLGEPFSLSELAEAGPNNYWKVSQEGAVPGLKSNDKKKGKSTSSNAGEEPEDYINRPKEPDKDMYAASDVEQPIQELSGNEVDDHVFVEENIMVSGKHGESFKPQKDKKVSNSANTVGISISDIESRSTTHALSSIKEGSYVEVLKDCGDSKAAWFSARVLSLKDREARVLYTKLQSTEGSEQLQEWVSIEATDDQVPKVRIPHDMTALQVEGTRKRRRAAAKDYSWSVGDKVDALVHNGWREGVIAERSTKEATVVTVHFPDQGELLRVKVWHLRPTLIWSDGQWLEWQRPGQDPASQRDSPAEKRPKLVGSSSIEAKGKTKVSESIGFAEVQRNEVPKLPLSANEKFFSIGSTKSEENKPNMVRTKRPGVEKQQGSRVVFGVPKPGKKRKFMEVSKHYNTSDRVTKTTVPEDSVKLSQYLGPLGSGSRGHKHNSKHDFKDKIAAESRPRSIRSGKPPSVPSRTFMRKDDSTSSRPNVRNAGRSDNGKDSLSSNDNESVEQNTGEHGSSSKDGGTSGSSMVFSSKARTQDNRKKTARRNPISERLNQRRPAAVSGRSDNSENVNSIPEVSEPRRSNRRIQPTSRVI